MTQSIPARSSTQLSLLAPQPQQITETGETFSIPAQVAIVLGSRPQELRFIASELARTVQQHGIEVSIQAGSSVGEGASIQLAVEPHLFARGQSYKLVVGERDIHILGADAAGVFYGVNTLRQLVDLYAPVDTSESWSLPGVRILDYPDFPYRGVMLDITRDRVPTMDELFGLVDQLACWKVNQLQLYTEHTFAYAGHEIVWQDASPMTGAEILDLDVYCRQRHVELVPNQNSFGHMHRWLKHDAYRHLAESPEGISHPFTPHKEPYSLCPTDPGSLDLLTDLYDQLLPLFHSRQVNVGLDETFDLGLGRSKELCEETGTGRVYLDFLNEIYAQVSQRGYTMQFWSDILVRDEPELVAELPQDVIALEWGYDADYPFDRHAKLIAESGRTFYVCPGTGTWNSLGGRTRTAVANLANAAINGYAHGAIGYLNTNWGDNGHMEPPPVSYLGYLVGACFAWNQDTARNVDGLEIPTLLDVHVFRDRAGVMGKLAYDLGNAYLQPGVDIANSSVLFWLVTLPDGLPERRRGEGLSREGLARTREYIHRVIAPLDDAQMQRADADLIRQEYRWIGDMLAFACRLGEARLDVGLERPVREIDPALRGELAEELGALIARQQEIWLQRSRPGGLADSIARLESTWAQLAA